MNGTVDVIVPERLIGLASGTDLVGILLVSALVSFIYYLIFFNPD